jgi:hypothetical protein
MLCLQDAGFVLRIAAMAVQNTAALIHPLLWHLGEPGCPKIQVHLSVGARRKMGLDKEKKMK